MTFPLKAENGVSSCGGLLVRPIIGRFCGYLTSGRSPFSNGSATAAANARKEGAAIPAPSAAMAAPECLMRLRLSIMACFFLSIVAGPRFSLQCRLPFQRRLLLGNLKPALRVQAHVATFSQV